MIDAFTWWLAVELLGLIALPFTIVLFKKLPDRGYAFGKALSILLLSFILWLAASAHILPNARWAIVLIIILMALGSLLLASRRRQQIKAFISENRNIVIVTELVFVGAFALWAVMRAYNPDLIFGEKPMELAFLNSIGRSEYLPPYDPWLSGFSISYYYFGYLMMATLTKLTGIAPGIAFNLSLALIFALVSVGAFSIVYNLIKMRRGSTGSAVGFGLVAVFLLLLLGNMEGVLELVQSHGLGSQGFWNWVGIEGLGHPYDSPSWYPTDHWWWWRASRVVGSMDGGVAVDYTITEFPFFSFTFADLHPHVMAMPFVLLNSAFVLEIFSTPASLGFSWLRRNWGKFLVFAIALGSLGFINTWDLPTYFFLFAVAAFLAAYWARGKIDFKLLREFGIFAVALLALAILLYLPYYRGSESLLQGITLVGNADTRPFQFFLMWGVFLFIGVSFVLAQAWGLFKEKTPSWQRAAWAIVIPFLPLVGWVLWTLAKHADFSIEAKFLQVLPFVAILSLILYIIISKAQRVGKPGDNVDKSSLFALILFFTAFLLTMGVELFVVDDLFVGLYERMNTVFKFYFQAWLLFAMASAFGLYYLWSRWSAGTFFKKVGRSAWGAALGVFVIAALIYPICATITFTDGMSRDTTLNGLAFVKQRNPSEAEAISWLNENVKGTPVIVEAQGEWGEAWRVSAYTGLPTILGSPGHEHQWRGSTEPLEGRQQDIALIYQSTDAGEVARLLEKYDVVYIYIGYLERQQYGSTAGDTLGSFLDVAFKNDGVTIYQVK